MLSSIFSVGDKVRCLTIEGNHGLLTVGKKYTIVGVDLFIIKLIADDGCLHAFISYRFELDVSSLRKEKLNKLMGND